MPHITIPAPPAYAYYEVGSTPQTSFPITFPFFSLPEVRVSAVAAGVETMLAYSVSPADETQYSVSGTATDGGYSGGTVTVGGAGASNCNVAVFRSMVPARLSDFPSGQALIDITALNTDLDRLAALLVDAYDRLDRCLRLSVADASAAGGSFVMPPIDLRKNRAIKFDSTGLNLIASTNDPDDATSHAAAAAAAATRAQSDAAVAKDAAISAQAAAESAGATSTVSFTVALVEGQNEYLLPAPAVSAQVVHLYWDGSRLVPGTDYTVGNTLGLNRTLVLLVSGVNVGGAAVSSDGADETHQAGVTYWGTVSGGIVDAAIGANSIKETNLDDLSVSTRTLQSAAVTGAKIAAGAITSSHVLDKAFPLLKVTTQSVAHGSLIVAGTSDYPVPLAQGSKYGLLRSQGANVSPAWGSSIIQLGFRDLSSGTEAVWTLPDDLSGIDAVEIQLSGGVRLSGSNYLSLQLGTGTSASPQWAASGYDGHGGLIQAEDFPAFTTGFIIARYLSNGPLFGGVKLRRVNGNSWSLVFSGTRTLASSSFVSSCGSIALGSPLTQLRLLAGGTNTFSGGSASAQVFI